MTSANDGRVCHQRLVADATVGAIANRGMDDQRRYGPLSSRQMSASE